MRGLETAILKLIFCILNVGCRYHPERIEHLKNKSQLAGRAGDNNIPAVTGSIFVKKIMTTSLINLEIE